MPSKKKGRKNEGGGPASLSQLFAAAVSSSSQETVIKNICNILGIPNVLSAKGLKQCHESFEAVTSTLDKVFKQCRDYRGDRVSSDSLAALIITIYGRIGQDNTLRMHVFSETQFFANATSLLSSGPTAAAGTVIETLFNITSFKDVEVARFTPIFLNYRVEDVGCILCRSTAAVFSQARPEPELVARSSLRQVLQLSLDTIRIPSSTPLIFRQFVYLCLKISESAHRGALHSIPTLVDFLIACTRAEDPTSRFSGQRSLIELCSDSAPNNRLGPAHIQLQDEYDGIQSFASKMIEGLNELKELLDSFDEDDHRSQHNLGHALSELIQCSEVLWGNLDEKQLGILQSCEAAIRRDSSGPEDDITADILHVVNLLVKEPRQVAAFAQASIERHPSVAFFYYATTVEPNSSWEVYSSVVSAEKGLQCSSITDSLRRSLLCHVANGSYRILTTLLESDPGDIGLHDVRVLMENISSHRLLIGPGKLRLRVVHHRTKICGSSSTFSSILNGQKVAQRVVVDPPILETPVQKEPG